MLRVGRALVFHELLERTRDRWVLVISLVFAALASAVSLYARSAEAAAASLAGPSLVTLVSLVIPLVALVLGHDAVVGERERNTLGLLLSLPVGTLEVVVAKFLGRALALAVAVGLGLGAALAIAPAMERPVLFALIVPTLRLGIAFLSLGVLVSSVTKRQITAASMAVTLWFLFVFFYDLGLLGLLVATDGAISQSTIAGLVFANPAGLYRIEMMAWFSGPESLKNMGLTVPLPSAALSGGLWTAWCVLPPLLSGLLLHLEKAKR
ncbi:MAG: ABC transporter permease subunit [Polyangiaceae bacterium]